MRRKRRTKPLPVVQKRKGGENYHGVLGIVGPQSKDSSKLTKEKKETTPKGKKQDSGEGKRHQGRTLYHKRKARHKLSDNIKRKSCLLVKIATNAKKKFLSGKVLYVCRFWSATSGANGKKKKTKKKKKWIGGRVGGDTKERKPSQE